MNHFFVEPADIYKNTVTITGQDVRHITNSLRLTSGDKITVSDGEENKYLVELTETNEDFVKGKIIRECEVAIEPSREITLVQGLPKSKKMDLIVQKSTELGVGDIIPLETKRTVVKLTSSKAQRRQKRWQKIAKEAAKQCGRTKIPKVRELIDFNQLLMLVNDYDLVLMAWEDEGKKSLKEIISNKKLAQKIMIIIGPEGGFNNIEVDKVKDVGGNIVSLGSRILRTETAGIASLTMLLYEYGDLG